MRFGNGDVADAAMRERAADKGNILHAREAEIGDKLATAAHQPVVFFAEDARADALPCHSDLLQSRSSIDGKHARRTIHGDRMGVRQCGA